MRGARSVSKKFLFDWNFFERSRMHSQPFDVQSLVDHSSPASTLIDSGNLTYGIISEKFARRQGLTMIDIEPKPVRGATGEGFIKQVVRARLDIDNHGEEGAFFYVMPDYLGYDLILGLPWLNRHDARLDPNRGRLYLRTTGSRITRTDRKPQVALDVAMISGSVMGGMIKRARRTKDDSLQIGAATMGDIQKALAPKKPIDPRTKLPSQYHDMLRLFEPKNAETLPPHRGKGIDHEIELTERDDGKEPELPWGPLYGMTKEELIVLRKTLTELLDKNFIRVSQSSAGAPVLFARKPGGGLRFCVDYRALNAISKRDRYPIPLIQETLNQVGRAKWFTKLDVSAAFHKIRITKGQEWMTAFRTRYGLFEWLVTPFGLANAPSTFQKYINWALREYLDEFCSAYLDDVLVYTDGPLKQHHKHVRMVLSKLEEAGLFLDIKKCEFDCTETKYLGYIIQAGKGVKMDPEKVQAIMDWQAPSTVKGVRGFLGFANFYRQFIPRFSQAVQPLVDLTRKDVPFIWSQSCQQSFDVLKQRFASKPVLKAFDPERTTVVETDSSGYNTGGVLSQYDEHGELHPCAYFSKKHSPAECNYEIYDKELLAIVRCLEAWDAELRSLKEFTVLTDHKNLEYFFQPRKLTERHVRWNLFLSRFNLKLQYQKGGENERADALSRKEQDMPKDADERVQSRVLRLLPPPDETGCARVGVLEIPYDSDEAWERASSEDPEYQEAKDTVVRGGRKFPAHLGFKISIAECSVDGRGRMMFRNRQWVPNWEPLRTELVRIAHEDPTKGHPGREETYATLARDYFWPRMSQDVRRYIRNCGVCGRTKPWREQKHGLLKPLPVPDQPWRDITIDFITGLPESEGHTNIAVVTDKLTKAVVFEGMGSITAEDTAWMLIRRVISQHGIPRAIVSDRGTQFDNQMWARACQLMGIERRLSTAWHPQTDGATERVNSVVEAYLRSYVCYDQSDWMRLLPMAELAINCRTATATGFSPFFLSHGYDVSPFQVQEDTESLFQGEPRSPIQQGENLVRKIHDSLDWARAALAFSQQEMEHQANRSRNAAPTYHQGDKVWLSLKNIRTHRPNKKLDWKNAKFEVLERVGTHAVRLNTPPGVHPVFHVDLLRPASTDTLPSQDNDDTQPPPHIIEGEEEWQVEAITGERMVRRGRGRRKEYHVKWSGYARQTWEPASALQETAALDAWEARRRSNGNDTNETTTDGNQRQ